MKDERGKMILLRSSSYGGQGDEIFSAYSAYLAYDTNSKQRRNTMRKRRFTLIELLVDTTCF